MFGNYFAAGSRVHSGRSEGARRGRDRNLTFARKFFGDEKPLGRTLTVYPGERNDALQMEIVGVAEDACTPRPARPFRRRGMRQWPSSKCRIPVCPSARLSVRAGQGSPLLLTRSVTAALASVNPNLALTFRPLAIQLHASLMREQLMAQLAGFFGALALLLAGLGLRRRGPHDFAAPVTEIGIDWPLAHPH